MRSNKYCSIDGLRTIACLCIVAMHIFANNSYYLPGALFPALVDSWKYFVILFMVISGFGMCCGYLKRFQNNQISLDDFYKKRYSKILPFFAALVLLDVLLSQNLGAVIEGFADITLLFGLFPNQIQVIGVGWFLGLIFAFYLIFPFYTVLMQNKKRAWAAFVVSLLLNAACNNYFQVYYENIVNALCYFMAGGLIYLYREPLEAFSSRFGWAVLLMLAASLAWAYLVRFGTIQLLLISSSMVIYAIGHKDGLLDNRFTHFISSVSMEIYLSHMVVFRILEKLKLNRIMGNGWGQYLLMVVLTVAGSAVGAVVFQKLWSALHKRLVRV